MSEVGVFVRSHYPGYNDEKIAAVLSGMTPKKAEVLFSKYSMEELEDLSSVFYESQDYEIKAYSSVISNVMKKKREGEYKEASHDFDADELEFIHMAVVSLSDYLHGIKEDIEYAKSRGLYVEYDVSDKGLEMLDRYRKDIDSKMKKKNKELSLVYEEDYESGRLFKK